MLRFIVMHCGYVESAKTSALIYGCEILGTAGGFHTYSEAISTLALDLYSKFYDDVLSTYEKRYSTNLKECCKDTLIVKKNAKFCAACGEPITNKQFSYQEFMDYVSDLHNSTCDNYGEADNTTTRELVWWPWVNGDFIGAPKEDIVWIAENAEKILLAALLEAKPELKEEDFDDCCLDDWEMFKSGKQPTYR